MEKTDCCASMEQNIPSRISFVNSGKAPEHLLRPSTALRCNIGKIRQSPHGCGYSSCDQTPRLECRYANLRRHSSRPNVRSRCLFYRRCADAAGFFACGHPDIPPIGHAGTPTGARAGCLLAQSRPPLRPAFRAAGHAVPAAGMAHADAHSGGATNDVWRAGETARHGGASGGAGVRFQSIADSHSLPSGGGGKWAWGLHARSIGGAAERKNLAAGA